MEFYKGTLDDARLIRFVEQLVRSMKGRKVYPGSSTTCGYKSLAGGRSGGHRRALFAQLQSRTSFRRATQPLAQKHAKIPPRSHGRTQPENANHRKAVLVPETD